MIGLHVTYDYSSLWATWQADPRVLVLLGTCAFLYWRGQKPVSRSVALRQHAPWRSFCYGLGLATIGVALLSPLDHLAQERFLFHMLQHLLLVLVGAPLVLLGAPMAPVLRGIPRLVRRDLVAPLLRSPLVRRPLWFLSSPIVAWMLYVATLLAWHVPAAYDTALRSEIVHDLEHISFFLTALLWWWNVITPIPLRPNLSYLGRVPYVFLATVPNFVLGAFLTFSTTAWYAAYQREDLPFALTTMEDQQIGGVLMWIPGSLVLLATLLLILVQVAVSEQRQQEEREQALRCASRHP